jgi:mannose-1-phosphate guanylyltransferase
MPRYTLRCLIVTGEDHRFRLQNNCEIGIAMVGTFEPIGRNTAPALTLAHWPQLKVGMILYWW